MILYRCVCSVFFSCRWVQLAGGHGGEIRVMIRPKPSGEITSSPPQLARERLSSLTATVSLKSRSWGLGAGAEGMGGLGNEKEDGVVLMWGSFCLQFLVHQS